MEQDEETTQLREQLSNLVIECMPLFMNKLGYPMQSFLRTEMNPSDMVLLALVEEGGEVSMGEVAQKLQISKQYATPLIDRLVRQDFLARNRVEADRRVVKISITPAGREALHEVQRRVGCQIVQHFLKLPDELLQEGLEAVGRFSALLQKL